MNQLLPIPGVVSDFAAVLCEAEGFAVGRFRFDGDSFGNMELVLKSRPLRVRFVLDRGQWLSEVGPGGRTEEWLDVDLIRRLREPNWCPSRNDEQEHLKQSVEFMRDNLAWMRNLVSRQEFDRTKALLAQLK